MYYHSLGMGGEVGDVALCFLLCASELCVEEAGFHRGPIEYFRKKGRSTSSV
eukprot:SAG31_NODE_594_length_13670_cov_2.624642_4_plen_52_part_00